MKSVCVWKSNWNDDSGSDINEESDDDIIW